MNGSRYVRGPILAFECGCAGEPRIEVPIAGRASTPAEIVCPRCERRWGLHPEHATVQGGVAGCLRCGHPELYTRKHFPPAAGITIVAIAAGLAPWTHYLSLLGAAALDFALYRFVADVVVCYVCGAEHRCFPAEPRHPRFDREIAERLRFGPRAVMGRPMRATGTANAPDPEH